MVGTIARPHPFRLLTLILDLATLDWRQVQDSPYTTNSQRRGQSIVVVQHGFTFLGVGGSPTIADVQVCNTMSCVKEGVILNKCRVVSC